MFTVFWLESWCPHEHKRKHSPFVKRLDQTQHHNLAILRGEGVKRGEMKVVAKECKITSRGRRRGRGRGREREDVLGFTMQQRAPSLDEAVLEVDLIITIVFFPSECDDETSDD
jgi:hypothetical protein